MATLSSVLAGRIPWAEVPGRHMAVHRVIKSWIRLSTHTTDIITTSACASMCLIDTLKIADHFSTSPCDPHAPPRWVSMCAIPPA